MMACPFGTVTYYPPQGKAIKCDECDGHPQCVLLCSTGALAYEEESAVPQGKRMKTARKLLSAAKEMES
jgi:Fe-S-cluster-containing hydrogenase component 2